MKVCPITNCVRVKEKKQNWEAQVFLLKKKRTQNRETRKKK